MNIKPLEDRVLIEVKEEEEKTPSGIYIPDTAKEKPQKGVVVAIGTDETIPVKVGDIVLFAKFAGNEIKVQDKNYLLLNKADLLAVIEE